MREPLPALRLRRLSPIDQSADQSSSVNATPECTAQGAGLVRPERPLFRGRGVQRIRCGRGYVFGRALRASRFAAKSITLSLSADTRSLHARASPRASLYQPAPTMRLGSYLTPKCLNKFRTAASWPCPRGRDHVQRRVHLRIAPRLMPSLPAPNNGQAATGRFI